MEQDIHLVQIEHVLMIMTVELERIVLLNSVVIGNFIE
jgi:hypothetical protein